MKKFIIFTGLILLSVTSSFAQYTVETVKPSNMTVSEIKSKAAKFDQKDLTIEIKGHILSQIDNETYWFEDSTGKIKVNIEQYQLPTQPFNEKNLVRIIGEVDYDLLEGVEFEAKKQITIIK